MKTFSRLTTSMLAGAALSVAGFSAYAAVETGDAQVVIVEPLVLTAVDTLDFGIISKPASGSVTRTVSPDSVVSGDATTGSPTNDNPAAGSFTVAGTDGLTVTVEVGGITGLPAGDITLEQFNIENGTGNSASGVDTSQGTITLNTAESITVGATMQIQSTIAAGTYDDITYDLTVDYQ